MNCNNSQIIVYFDGEFEDNYNLYPKTRIKKKGRTKKRQYDRNMKR